MDFVRSHFGTNEPLTSWTLFLTLFGRFALCAQQTGQKVRKKVFNWSEVHLYQSNFLQNPYFNYEDRKMCIIKIELSKITYRFQIFQILFKLGLKLLLFCCFPHLTKEIERCAYSRVPNKRTGRLLENEKKSRLHSPP